MTRLETINISNIYGYGKGGEIIFVAGMPNLERIDITNNYVSDLSPLTNCANLTYVRCSDNSYSSLPEFRESVYIDERGEEDFSHK